VPLEHSQALLAGLHRRDYDIADAPELAAARHDDWHVVYGTSEEQFDVDERTLTLIRENAAGGSVPLLEDFASAALGERVTLASTRPPMTKAWAAVYTRSFQALPYEIFAADEADADAQLELLARSLGLRHEISVAGPTDGWATAGRILGAS